MLHVLGCITEQHDPGLVALAACICALACSTTLDLIASTQGAKNKTAVGYLAASAVVFGAGVWALHFVAMLAFLPGVPVAYRVSMTAVSVIVAIIGALAAFSTWLFCPSRRIGVAGGGVLLGLSISAMHYCGVLAMQLPGTLHFAADEVAASIGISIAFAVLALFRTANLASRWRRIEPALWLALAICGLHFTGMTALSIELGAPVDQHGAVLGSTALAVTVGTVSVAILIISLGASLMVQRLTEREQRLEDYVMTAADWFWETDADMRFTRVTPQARDHGIEPNDLIGLHRLTTNDAEEIDVRCRDLLGLHAPFSDLRYDYCGERGLQILSLTGLPIFTSTRRFIGYRGSARDITRQLQIEAGDRSARWAAEEASRAKSTFLATMSHEIRTPMNGILGMVQLLSDTPLNSEQRHMCDVIFQSGHALHEILNDILDYSKLEAGKITLELVDSSLLDIVGSVVDLMRGTAEARGLTVEVEVAGGALPPLVIDPTRFRQILSNLLSNAIKFSEQGVITIRLSGVPVGTDRQAITLTVADQGIGISPEAQRRLFSHFSQADGSTTRRFGGTGLGLAISRELVTLMGGTISVSSVVGQGSTFTVQMTLPIGEAVVAPVGPLRWTEQVADAQVLDVLVAEDNEINQEIIKGMLRGHRLTMASDGRQAVAAVQDGRFDLILMDVMMPVMNGLKATAAIRSMVAPAADTPIIALTANAMSGDEERYLGAGMNGYVSKPIDRRQLFDIIEQVVGKPIWRQVAADLPQSPVLAASETASLAVDAFIASLDL